MSRSPAWPDGERVSAAVAAPEVARELDPPIGLAEALAGFLRAAEGRRDLRARASELRFRDGGLLVGGERVELRPLAATQLQRLVLRRGRVVARGDDLRRGLKLLADHVLVLRLDQGEVRAIVGERFATIDDADMLARITRAASAMSWSDLRVRYLATNERITIVRATLGRSRMDVRPGDPFERGLEIRNSEVGARAFSLSPLTWRGRCFNVTLGQPTLRLVHVGARPRVLRDWRKELAICLDRARTMLDAWCRSAAFDAANAITSAARLRGLASRVAAERRAQRVVEDAALID